MSSSTGAEKEALPLTRNKRPQKCCTWPTIILVFIIIAAIGLGVWLFVPIGTAVRQILPNFNVTEGQPGGEQEEAYVFMQCNSTSPSCCNGLKNICDLRADEIMYATSHNANAALENGFIVLPNHVRELEDSLEAGYRGLSLDLCFCGGVYVFCHGFCQLGQRDVDEVLGNIVSFMERNPTEVLLLILQIDNSAGDPIDLDEFHTYVQTVNGFIELLYVHPTSTSPWPTLGTMVDLNRRIVLFHHEGPNCGQSNPCPAGFHYWWTYAMETEFSFGNKEELLDTEKSCQVTRGEGGTRSFFAVNTFVTFPDDGAALEVNEAGFLETRVNTCSAKNGGANVNLVFVDFWSLGDLPQVVQEHNAALGTRRERRSVLRSQWWWW